MRPLDRARLQQYVLTQALVIVQILIAVHDAVEALADEILQRMGNQFRIARVVQRLGYPFA